MILPQGKAFSKDYIIIIVYYLLFYASGAVMTSFMPPFLKENIGMTEAQIGIILATGPMAALLIQPVWGMKADRSRYMNSILIIILTGTLAAALLIPLYARMSFSNYTMFWLIMAGMLLLNCFQSSTIPMTDTIVSEICHERRWDFGRIRIAASVGFSVMGALAGVIIGGVLLRIFPLFAGLSLLAIGAAFFIPRVPGKQRKKIPMPYLRLMKNKRLVKVVGISLICSMTMGMHYSFYGIYFRQLGGSTAMLGLAVAVSSMAELPFSMYSKKIIKKLGGTEHTLLLAMGVMSIRWLLASLAKTPLQLIFINSLHGFSYIVLVISVILFISENVPPELRASGQAFNGMAAGIARILGSVFSGLIISRWGISAMFTVAFTINVLFLLIFIFLGRKTQRVA